MGRGSLPESAEFALHCVASIDNVRVGACAEDVEGCHVVTASVACAVHTLLPVLPSFPCVCVVLVSSICLCVRGMEGGLAIRCDLIADRSDMTVAVTACE